MAPIIKLVDIANPMYMQKINLQIVRNLKKILPISLHINGGAILNIEVEP